MYIQTNTSSMSASTAVHVTTRVELRLEFLTVVDRKTLGPDHPCTATTWCVHLGALSDVQSWMEDVKKKWSSQEVLAALLVLTGETRTPNI